MASPDGPKSYLAALSPTQRYDGSGGLSDARRGSNGFLFVLLLSPVGVPPEIGERRPLPGAIRAVEPASSWAEGRARSSTCQEVRARAGVTRLIVAGRRSKGRPGVGVPTESWCVRGVGELRLCGVCHRVRADAAAAAGAAAFAAGVPVDEAGLHRHRGRSGVEVPLIGRVLDAVASARRAAPGLRFVVVVGRQPAPGLIPRACPSTKG